MEAQRWKPISTAPKGIYLLLYKADGFFSNDTVMEVATVEQFGQTATHWMALPNTPEHDESK